jgi:hypothetical protein
LRRAFEALEPEAIEAMRDHLTDRDPKHAVVRQRAAEYVIDRLYGRPAQAVDIKVAEVSTKTDAELEAALIEASGGRLQLVS